MTEIVRAALADGNDVVLINPLHWICSNVFGSRKWRGMSPFGEFSAFSEDDFTVDQIEAKKATIQSDYEKQIRSALAKLAD